MAVNYVDVLDLVSWDLHIFIFEHLLIKVFVNEGWPPKVVTSDSFLGENVNQCFLLL